MGVRKGEIISQLNAHGIHEFAGQGLEKLTMVELRELLAQTKEPEVKMTKDPMSGLDRLRRQNLENILTNLDGQTKRAEKNKGALLMNIRKKISELHEAKIEIGKNKGTSFQELLASESYVNWMYKTTTKDSDPRLKMMYQYCRLMQGVDKREAKEKGEEELSDMETIPQPFPESEPIMMNQRDKKPAKTETPRTTQAVKIIKPEWTGKEEDWEEYAQACSVYARQVKEEAAFNSMKDSEKRSRQ